MALVCWPPPPAPVSWGPTVSSQEPYFVLSNSTHPPAVRAPWRIMRPCGGGLGRAMTTGMMWAMRGLMHSGRRPSPMLSSWRR